MLGRSPLFVFGLLLAGMASAQPFSHQEQQLATRLEQELAAIRSENPDASGPDPAARLGFLRVILDELDRLGAEPRPAVPKGTAETGITGTITDAETGAPIANEFFVFLYDAAGDRQDLAFTDATGSYSFTTDLSAGTYFVVTSIEGYFDELYDDIPCPVNCDPTTGTPITVTSGSITSGIDFTLSRGGVITGTVTEAGTGLPLADQPFVALYDSAGEMLDLESTDEAGSYTFAGLSTGTYFVATDLDDHFDELYDDIPCPIRCDVTAGTPVAVTFGSTTSGVDFTLVRGGAITGTVTDAETGAPIASQEFVALHDASGGLLDFDPTESDGSFTFGGLPTGAYYVRTLVDGYFNELYDDLPCPIDCDVTVGTPISVTFGATTSGVDVALGTGGAITGTVTEAGTGLPIADEAFVLLYGSAGNLLGLELTDEAGAYTFVGIPTGTYFVATDITGYANEVYDDIPCPPDCDVTVGTPISVTVGATTGIDFALGDPSDPPSGGPCAGAICLNANRFQVDVGWRTAQGGTGQARAVPGVRSDDSGVLYFFTENNWEMLIKVLDGCGITNHFWVFAAATTDVEYTLTVTDTVTRQSKSYFNPLGTAAASITDTSALAVCDSGTKAASESAVRTVAPARAYVDELAKQGTCADGPTSLCLNRKRFKVEVDWRTASGAGSGQVVQVDADDSGLFYFFNANNWEMLVKVLDGCGITDHFWVFAAATTDVGYTLRVTDTANGTVKEYRNPIGRAAPAITDTSAFATCP